MRIFKLIKKKIANHVKNLKNFEDEDLFAVSIDDDFDSAVVDSEKNITPCDDGYGDEEAGIMTN